MARTGKFIPRPKAKGWTVYEHSGDIGTSIRADGELAPLYRALNVRPATDAEITAEVARRLERDEVFKRHSAFRARPDYQDADAIRSAIELIELDDHLLDRLTPEEWRALRIKICGPRSGE